MTTAISGQQLQALVTGWAAETTACGPPRDGAIRYVQTTRIIAVSFCLFVDPRVVFFRGITLPPRPACRHFYRRALMISVGWDPV